MRVISKPDQIKKPLKNVVLAIGVFDGLHKGHQELIRKTIQRAKALKGTSVVMTFYPHPVHVLHPEIPLPLVISLPHRLQLLKEMGVDVCFLIRFTKKFSRLSPEQFIRQYILKCLHTKEIFVGDDFRFGQNRTGTLDYFQSVGQSFGFKVNILHAVKGRAKTISSTRIRELIAQGKLKETGVLLGRRVAMMGTVQSGEARGKILGFPTANIYPTNEVIPPVGVYAVYVVIQGRRYPAMANIGYRPSFRTHDNRVNVEVHIFNFHQNLYGKDIIIEFVKRIRDEKIFLRQKDLIRQLEKDRTQTQAILKK